MSPGQKCRVAIALSNCSEADEAGDVGVMGVGGRDGAGPRLGFVGDLRCGVHGTRNILGGRRRVYGRVNFDGRGSSAAVERGAIPR